MDAQTFQNLSAKRQFQHTRAIRLAVALERWQCEQCCALGARVYATKESVRYIRCRKCGAKAKISVS